MTVRAYNYPGRKPMAERTVVTAIRMALGDRSIDVKTTGTVEGAAKMLRAVADAVAQVWGGR